MPSERASIRAANAPAVPLPVRLVRLAANAIMLLVATVCVALLLVRFAVFPRIEAHHDDIAAYLGTRIGQPVAIGAIVTGWDGWSPRLSVRGFRVFDPVHAAVPVLDLPRVDLVVSWTSIPLLDLTLKALDIQSPRLSVRRDPAGRIHVGGIALDPAAGTDDNAVTDWLLRQRRIAVHDGLVTWTDEQRNAPQLVLDQVELRVEQGFGVHRFGLTGVPPAELAAPLDVRGDFSAASLRDWPLARGRAYVRLDYADLAAWREWLPLPVAVDRGKGALRLWFEFGAGAPRAITADLELVDVRATLGPDLPPVELAHVSGRVSASQQDGRREVTTRGLTFTTQDGTALAPTDLRMRYDDARGTAPAHGEIAFDRLALAPLTALAAHLPLAERWRQDLANYAPTGNLEEGRLDWDGAAAAPRRYHASGRFAAVGFRPYDASPGATGMTGRFDADEAKGSIDLSRAPLVLAMPHVFAAPVTFDSAAARVSWTRPGDRLLVRIDDASFANGDLAGTAAGTWRAESEGPGTVDLHGRLTRASVEPLARYLPVQVGGHLREWLLRALVKGQTNDVRMVLKGNLADFPFPQGKAGQFELTIKARDGTLDYAENWPPLRDVEADVKFAGTALTIEGSRGRVLGAALSRTRVSIADLRQSPATLNVEGEVEGPTAEFVSFMAKSPVGEWINHAADNVQVSGNGRLGLKFSLPLAGGRATELVGDYQFVDNQLKWTGAPALAKVNGKLSFTDQEVQAHEITAEVFGGPAKLQLQSGDGHMRISGSGNANVALLRHEFDVPLVDRMTGSADWKLNVDSRADALGWTIESSLKGAAVELPAPLGKLADATIPLRVTRRELHTGRDDALTVDYGTDARIMLHRLLAPAGTTVDRALVLLGRAVAKGGEPTRSGLWIRAEVPALDVDDWLAFQRAAEARANGSPQSGGPVGIAFDGIDVDAGVLRALGRRFNELKVSGRRTGNEWRLTLDGREVDGSAVWQGAAPAMPNGRLVARLTRFTPPAAGELEPVGTVAESTDAPAAAAVNPWPAIDVTAESLVRHGRPVGRLEVLAEPAGADWQIRKLSLANDAGRIDAQGVWRGGREPQTRLDVKLDVREAGAFLARFAMPDAIRGAASTIDGQVSWAGAPSDFDYPSLTGAFRLASGAGQFLKADPGVGRLLGVLSLQALPRRISLDFRDVFSEGFAFDNVTANVQIRNGVMHTDAFHLAGPAAGVDIAGDVDLARETQQLRVRVQPSLSSSVSAGTAALFLANPLLGAAVGAGTLLAQKMMNNPIEQLFSYEYGVSGGWDDPLVQRLNARTAAAWPETTTK